jgi:hypothetical protein
VTVVVVLPVRVPRESVRNLASEIYRARPKLTLLTFLSFSSGLRVSLSWGGRFAGIPSGRAVAKIVCIPAWSSGWRGVTL